jgi:large subunit ribosomal protein L21
MAYAIIQTGGKQLRVETGRFYDVERLAVEPDESVTIDQVLFVDNDGDIAIGQPLVEGATIEATVLRHLRGRKIIVYKMRPKKKTRKKQGHRQELTRLMIDSIYLNGVALKGSTIAEVPVAGEAPVLVDEDSEPVESPVPMASVLVAEDLEPAAEDLEPAAAEDLEPAEDSQTE